MCDMLPFRDKRGTPNGAIAVDSSKAFLINGPTIYNVMWMDWTHIYIILYSKR